MCSIIIMSDVDPQMAVAPCTMLALIQDPARISSRPCSRVAQWKRAGPITQRSVDRNYALLNISFHNFSKFHAVVHKFMPV